MKRFDLLPLNIERMTSLCDIKHHIDNDLVLADITELPLPNDSRHMECTLVGICLSGSASYTLGTVTHRVKTNDVLIVGHDQVLGDITTSSDFRAEALVISKEFLNYTVKDVSEINGLFLFSHNHPVFRLTSSETAMFMDYYAMIKQKVDDTNHVFRRQVVGTLLASMVYDLCNSARRVANTFEIRYSLKSQGVFENYIRLVETHFRHERRVSWYSDQLGVSSKTLLEVVKRVSSRTPNDWLDIYTIRELQVLLRNSTKSIKQISEELHFGTQSSMGKFFKEHVGTTPTAYRKP